MAQNEIALIAEDTSTIIASTPTRLRFDLHKGGEFTFVILDSRTGIAHLADILSNKGNKNLDEHIALLKSHIKPGFFDPNSTLYRVPEVLSALHRTGVFDDKVIDDLIDRAVVKIGISADNDLKVNPVFTNGGSLLAVLLKKDLVNKDQRKRVNGILLEVFDNLLRYHPEYISIADDISERLGLHKDIVAETIAQRYADTRLDPNSEFDNTGIKKMLERAEAGTLYPHVIDRIIRDARVQILVWYGGLSYVPADSLRKEHVQLSQGALTLQKLKEMSGPGGSEFSLLSDEQVDEIDRKLQEAVDNVLDHHTDFFEAVLPGSTASRKKSRPTAPNVPADPLATELVDVGLPNAPTGFSPPSFDEGNVLDI